ncbi:hypothetical protein E4Z66_18410 [Aliishimia ponticola]|uniref:Uncharacterized protein n=1 Tax=Aliishimia ponticola TaxID=2499833 RepID=A0A4S4NEE0_9RHOB|nr:hypothetical protein [Aliishimia ponticola]THH34410.1 hypothetical protein E4Z66_18410 [Aliishimia ponticola]
MIIAILVYIPLALSMTAALSFAILHVGTLSAECPEQASAARISAFSIATGFAATGTGGVLLIGALMLIVPETHTIALAFCLGLAALCLGLGFSHAVATLGAVTQRNRQEPTEKA